MANEVTALVAGFDPDAIPADAVIPLHDRLQEINRKVNAAITLLARRVDEVQQWKRAGYASAAEYLAAKAGSSVASANDVLGASAKLASLPVVEDALRAGKLSGSQAVVVTDAAALAPAAQARLVNDAQRSSLTELRQECLRTKAAADGTGRRRERVSIASATCGRSPTLRVLAMCTSAVPSTRSPNSKPVCSRSSTTSSSKPN